MIRKSLIALAAAATLATGMAATASTAEAKTFINVGLGFGGFGYGGYGYGGYPVYDAGCGYHWIHEKVWNWNHTHKIWIAHKIYDCY